VNAGATSSITGPFVASLLIGVADVAGKYYVPKFGAFVIYTIMIIVLLLRPQGLFARASGTSRRGRHVVAGRGPGSPPSRRARALAPARIPVLAGGGGER